MTNPPDVQDAIDNRYNYILHFIKDYYTILVKVKPITEF